MAAAAQVSSVAGGVAALLRYAPDDVLHRTIVVIWVRQLKTELKYMNRMLPELNTPLGVDDEDVKRGELRGVRYQGGTLLGHEHLGNEMRDAVWVCFVPCVERGEGAKVHGFGKLVASTNTRWTSWAEAARHAGSGVTPAEAAARDKKHPVKKGGTLFLWRLDPASVVRLREPIAIQRCYSPTPGPTPLHITAHTLLHTLPAQLLDTMVLTVVPQPLTDHRAKGQQPPAAAAAADLPLRLSQQQAAGDESEEGESEGEEEVGDGEEEVGEGESAEVGEGAGVGEEEEAAGVGAEEVGEATTPPPPPPVSRTDCDWSDWTPVQRKGVYRALLEERRSWLAAHPGKKRAIVPRTNRRRRRVPTPNLRKGS